MKHKLIRSRILAGILILAMLLPACSSKKQERPELLEPVNAKLESALVERRDLSDITLYSAQLLPEIIEMGFEDDGYLNEVYVGAGDKVGEGTVLASLVGHDYNTIKDMESELADIKEEFEEKFRELEIEIELQRLAGRDTEELELELKHQREREELAIEEKEAKLAAMKENDIGYNYITAPSDCTVMAVTNTRAGGYLAGGSPVVAIDGGGKLSLTCDFINENTIRHAHSYYAVIRGERYEIEYQAYTKDELRIMSANSVSPVSRFEIKGDTSGLNAGDYALVIYVSGMQENVLVVPAGAVYSDSTGKYVYEIVDNTRIKRMVVTGISDSSYVEIVEGIEEGAFVYVKN